MTSGLVSSSTLPTSAIAAAAASSCSGFSSGGRVNMYGVWHVPTAATISPIAFAPAPIRQSLVLIRTGAAPDQPVDAGIDLSRVPLVDLARVRGGQERGLVQIPFRVVVVVAGFRIDAA